MKNRNYIKIEHFGKLYPADSYDICRMLGIPNGRTPAAGMAPTILQGIKVWIEPLEEHDGVRTYYGRLRKRSTHRLLAECPECGKIMSTGRLKQHICGGVK